MIEFSFRNKVLIESHRDSRNVPKTQVRGTKQLWCSWSVISCLQRWKHFQALVWSFKQRGSSLNKKCMERFCCKFFPLISGSKKRQIIPSTITVSLSHNLKHHYNSSLFRSRFKNYPLKESVRNTIMFPRLREKKRTNKSE